MKDKESCTSIITKSIQNWKTSQWKLAKNKMNYEILQEELFKEYPKMPRKLQPAKIKNEPLEELVIRKELAKEKLRCQVRIHKIRYEREQNTINQIENQVKSMTKDQINSTTRQSIMKIWHSKTNKIQQRISNTMNKKKIWLKKNLTNEMRQRCSKTVTKIQDVVEMKRRSKGKQKKKNRWRHREKKASKFSNKDIKQRNDFVNKFKFQKQQLGIDYETCTEKYSVIRVLEPRSQKTSRHTKSVNRALELI